MRFRIEHHLKSFPQIVIARRLDPGDFTIEADTLLGGAALSPCVTQPRALLEDGRLDLDLFAFALKRRSDLALLPVGKVVELSSSSDGA